MKLNKTILILLIFIMIFTVSCANSNNISENNETENIADIDNNAKKNNINNNNNTKNNPEDNINNDSTSDDDSINQQTENIDDEKPLSSPKKVSLTIVGKDMKLIIKDEYVIEDETAEFSVLDILKYVCEKNNILLDYSGSGRSAYIKGINNLYEFDYGSASGWVYYVNEVYVLKSVSSYIVSPGDNIVFYYSLDYGRDIDPSEKIREE